MSQDDISYNVWAFAKGESPNRELIMCAASGKEVKVMLFEQLQKDLEDSFVELLNDNLARFGFHCTYEESLSEPEECSSRMQEFLEGVKNDELCSTWNFGGMEHNVAIEEVKSEG